MQILSETADYMDEIANFVAVVRAGSLAAAARELGVPKSTISRRISRLEAALGVLLVHRNRRKLTLSQEGCRLYDRVAASVDIISMALSASQENEMEARGHLRISAPGDFGQLVLPKLLTEFRTLYPDISLELKTSDRFVDMVQEGFDLAIRAGDHPNTASAQNLITRKLLPGRHVLVGNSAYAKRVETLDDLKSCPFLLFRSEELQQQIQLTDTKGRHHQLTVHGRCIVHDYASMSAFVLAGEGVALLPRLHLEHGSPELRQVLPDYVQHSPGVVIVYPSRQLPHRATLLLEHLVQRLA